MVASPGPTADAGLFDGRYCLKEQIGRGGTAEVYRAHDTKTQRHVALKRSLPVAPARLARRRELLEREYYTLAQLAHPRIIEVYEYGVADSGAYYTMELLDKGDLSSGEPWPWQRACALLVDVASSLAILHARGLLHRDVSARNVRRGRDERVKLIDFGALSSIGMAVDVVGTPPYVPPEALQMQVLDARADLFGLGALAYYLLSGRHAFPARKLADLRDSWRSSPMPLTKLARDLPEPLVELTTQLLSLDRMARPGSAADVIRRLCMIAGLPIEEELAVSRAYLTTPVLVGRGELQVRVRKSLLRLMNAEGQTLLIEGPAGSGRTRALDACVLDGRMLGAQVVRADATLGADGDWGVARAICAQLLERLPRQAEAAALPLTPWLAPVLAELRSAVVPKGGAVQRNARIRGLRDFILALSQRERLLIAVDDVDRIDEPSLALLAALSGHAEGRGLLLALTLETTDNAAREGVDAALRVLRTRGRRSELASLSVAQTDALLRSVFGGVPNASLLAPRVHALARGNPRDTMELAQHLVERGLARYEAGLWLLPDELSEHDLPESMAASLLGRVNALSADARELAELTAVTELPGLSSAQYEALCAEWAHGRLYRALQELIAARVLLCSLSHYTLCSRAYAKIVLDAMTGERARTVHARWVRVLSHTGAEVLPLAAHLIDAGRAQDGIDLLLTLDLRMQRPRLSLLQRALCHAAQLDLPVRKARQLRLGLLTSSTYALDVSSFATWAPGVLEELVQDSGLAAYAELAHIAPDDERLKQALVITRQRYLALPEQRRGATAAEAISSLLRLATFYCVMAIWTLDVGVLDGFPSLRPLCPLSGAVELMIDLLQVARDWVVGRHRAALFRLEAMLPRVLPTMPQAQMAGVDDVQRTVLSNTLRLLLGMLQALYGIRECEVHARALGTEESFRAAAWRIRQRFQLSQGNWQEANSCGRRAEVVRLQQGGEPIAGSGVEATELYAAALLGDLTSVRAALERVSSLAAQHPGWQPVLECGRAHYAALHGDWDAALERVERGLRLAIAGRHSAYADLAALHVQALCALGRLDEAVERGSAYQQLLDAAGIGPAPLMAAALARALSGVGRHAQALLLLESAAAQSSELAGSGLLLGQVFESAAYVALAARDEARFEVSFTACALEYKKSQSAPLGARLLRLFDAARAGRLRVVQLTELLDEAGVNVLVRLDQVLLSDRFGECVDRADRAHCALSFVLAQAERSCGYLYVVGDDDLTLLGGIPDDQPPAELLAWARTWLARQPLRRDAEQVVTETVEWVTESEAVTAQEQRSHADDADTGSARLVTADGREFEPSLLVSFEHAPVGLLMLEVGRGTRLMPTRSVLADVVSLLAEYGDLPSLRRR